VARDQVDEIVLVGGSTRIPAVQKMLLDYFQGGRVEHLNTQVDPDGAVALGAAIYGYTLVHPDDPFSQSIMLLDITPISLGVEVLQSQMSIIIPRNTIIPTKCTCMYTTDTDHQDSVIIRIFEGEHQLTCHNRLVATLELSGFQKAPKGHALIAITFQIDANRMLHVMAQERCSGVYRDITLVNLWDSDRLNPEKIEKMAQRICAEDYISRTQLERTRPAGTSDQARELFWELAEETQKILKSFDAHEYPRIPMHQFRKELDLHYLWYHSHPNAKTTEYLDHTRSLQKLSENLLAHTEKKISDKNSILLKLDFEKLNSDFHYKYKFHSNRQES
jgi:molecular chaperone DnaK (HSP70)